MRPQSVSRITSRNNDLQQVAEPLAHHLPTDTCQIDPDLAALIEAWDRLSSEQRRRILDIARQ
jgi:hypothetical protein